MWRVLKSLWQFITGGETVWSIVTYTGYGGVLVSLFGGLIAGLLAFLSDMNTPAIFLFIIVGGVLVQTGVALHVWVSKNRPPKPQAQANELADFLQDGVNLFARVVSTSGEFQQWERNYDKWRGIVADKLEAYYGKPERIEFEALGSIPAMDITGSFGNGRHNTLRVHLNIRNDRLRGIVARKAEKISE